MISEIQALNILTSRGLSLVNDRGKFRVYDQARNAITAENYDNPLVAIEEAEKTLLVSEIRTREVTMKRIFSSLEMAVYVPWPRQRDGVVEWAILRVSDRSQVGGVFGGLLPCCLEIAKLLNQPVDEIVTAKRT